MPRKTKVVEVEPEIEPESAQETQEEEAPEEVEVTKPESILTKPKRILTEKQLENLKRAREAALLKKRELKELAQKSQFEEVYKHATSEPYNALVIDNHPKTDRNKRFKKNFDVVLTHGS